MKFFLLLAAFVLAVAAETDESYPEYVQSPRFRRDVTFDRKVGANGKMFGTLGSNDAGLFGRGGYEHNIFNDGRGRLDAQAHGTRVLGPYGDSSHLGGNLNWQNSHATASLGASKQIHGPSSINAAAGGKWPVGKNGDFSVQGFYDKTSGMRHDYGANAAYNHRFRRELRDLTFDHQVGKDGKVFGTLGSTDAGLFGRGGYAHNIFNDGRGRLDAQAHGTRVLGPYGDSSHLGGNLNWQNSHATASLGASKQIHGPSSINAAAGGKWPVGKNGDFSVQGFYDKTSGMRHDYGANAAYNHRFRRDVRDLRKEGDEGKIFGTMGSNGAGLFGRAGYESNIFNDARGRLDVQAHGTRVLGPNGDSSHLGGNLNWQNSQATASLAASKQIHGPFSINAEAGGKWPVGKNGDFSAQGFYEKTSGMKHDYGAKAEITYHY